MVAEASPRSVGSIAGRPTALAPAPTPGFEWQPGPAGGGYVGASFALKPGLALVTRFDVDMWRVDALMDNGFLHESAACRGIFVASVGVEVR